MLAELAQPYTTTAKAKGANALRVHFRHTLRAALPPVLTILTVLFGGMLANAVVVETVFSRDGVGRIAGTAVSLQDIPVVQAVVMVGAVCFVLLNLLSDVLSWVLDPRTAPSSRSAIGGAAHV